LIVLLYGVLSALSKKEKKSKKDSKHSRKDKKERSSSSSKSSKAAAEAASSSSVAMNQNKFGMWGILRESDLFKKQREFEVWMQLEKKVKAQLILLIIIVSYDMLLQ
jgi:hypothetical protein